MIETEFRSAHPEPRLASVAVAAELARSATTADDVTRRSCHVTEGRLLAAAFSRNKPD